MAEAVRHLETNWRISFGRNQRTKLNQDCTPSWKMRLLSFFEKKCLSICSSVYGLKFVQNVG
jgi:hypothetical protein